MMNGLLRRIVIRGGPGSGHFGHEGRPGEVGGSQPGAPTMHVGITGARPGEPRRQTIAEMAGFRRALGSLSGVRDARVMSGIGAWQGGREATWVTEYAGNGEALRLVAQTAKDQDQDSVLLYSEGGQGVASSMTDLLLTEALSLEEKSAIEEALVRNGATGWTWFRHSGGIGLRLVVVPQWGGSDESHARVVAAAEAVMSGATRMDRTINVAVMEREGEHAYSDYLR